MTKSKVKLFHVKIPFDVKSKTVNFPLSNGCRDLLFKADTCAIKRPSQAEKRRLEKGNANQKVDFDFGFDA